MPQTQAIQSAACESKSQRSDRKQFRPALIVVDFQEDFCPPNGSLAVANGRDIASSVNHLLSLPFVLKVATRDWHPPNHVSFATNHPGSKPFTSSTTITHPQNLSRSYTTTLWPDHCLQNSAGAQLVPELDTTKLDAIIDKGQNPTVEMYSAFYDPFHVSDSGLVAKLRGANVTDVFVVGLAADFCVKATAQDAQAEGFQAYIVEEGTRPVAPEKWNETKAGILTKGVQLVALGGIELGKVKSLA
ncbi:hypothetical protein HIM_04139 [Hirsutella minnesotensis 3608]|uniref:nicotinamidase n=1 Tax=Hirsutella minnesotensis 3608 TaxID=1043627 RepID=A0A0F7ZQ05_9HYPO|nr:hypothetical protein HIM_04139 [Hirsutella minnesotensis 3608]